MGIYLTLFLVTALFFGLSNSKRIHKHAKRFFALIGIILPSILAGLRGSHIGTDLQIYGINNFNIALRCQNFVQFCSNSCVNDIGFNFLTYLSSRISRDYHLALFLYEFLTMTFIYLFMKECSKKYKISLGITALLYLLSFFNVSLNVMRQCIAVSIVAYGFTYLWKGKRLSFLLFIALAYTFHSTSLIGLVLYPLYSIFFNGRFGAAKQTTLMLAFALFTVALLISFASIVRLLVGVGILNAKYLEYIAGGYWNSKGSNRPSISNLIMQPLLFLLVLISAKSIDKKYKRGGVLISI